MKSWGLYFLVLGLTLSAMAAVSLHLLYSWKVAPVLAVNKATQARHHKVFEDDLEYLSHFEVFEALAPMKNPNRDAGTLLNAKFSWTPSPQGQLSHVDPELAERLIRMGTDWITLAAKQKTNAKYNFPVLGQLNGFDHWDVEKNGPIETLITEAKFVPPPQVPIPDPNELLTATKLNLIRGAQDKSFLATLSSTRKLAELLMSSENLQLVLAGLSVLDSERRAYRYYVDELGFDEKAWTPIDRNVTRRAHRAILATRGYLRLWTEPELLAKYFLADKPVFGFCAVANESFPLEFSLRRVLEPRWPLEMNLHDEYEQLDKIFARAQESCRLRYLSHLVEADQFADHFPGPLILNRLPYSRKVFGMRLSAANFDGFYGYDKAAAGHNPASD